MIIPFGTYITPKRLSGRAGVFCSAASAGIMLSSSGSASTEPMPRSTVRRGIAFFAMNIARLSFPRIVGQAFSLGHPERVPLRLVLLLGQRDSHGERRAADDGGDDRRP